MLHPNHHFEAPDDHVHCPALGKEEKHPLVGVLLRPCLRARRSPTDGQQVQVGNLLLDALSDNTVVLHACKGREQSDAGGRVVDGSAR